MSFEILSLVGMLFAVSWVVMKKKVKGWHSKQGAPEKEFIAQLGALKKTEVKISMVVKVILIPKRIGKIILASYLIDQITKEAF